MKSRKLLFLAVTVVLLAAAPYANAASQTKPVTGSNNVEAVYDETKAFAGNDLELEITVQPFPGATLGESERLTLGSVRSDDSQYLKIKKTSGGSGG